MSVLGLLLNIALLLLPMRASADVDRYVVGQHLRAFEKTWEKYGTSVPARQRTVQPLFGALRDFFAARWSESAKYLDQARHALQSEKPPAANVRWADSLVALPATRLLDTSASALPVTLRPFYQIEGKEPPAAKLRVMLVSRQGKLLAPAVEQAIVGPLVKLQLPLQSIPEGDHILKSEIRVGDTTLAASEQTISFARHFHQRLMGLGKGWNALPPAKTTDSATLQELLRVLEVLDDGGTLETDYPAARLLAEAEALLQALQAGKRYYGKDRTGQFWLKLALPGGARVARVLVPEAAREGKPLPLVVALHGAAGSENLFFDAYGRGKIVELCRKRGWLLVAPRSPLLTFHSPTKDIVDEIARLYPVDRTRIFVVGHSMGAAQALNSAQEQPQLLAAVAALGGSARVADVAKIKRLAFFIGVGDRDFALEGARTMAQVLRKAGVSMVEYREYPAVEHITIVQAALPEAFALFDKAAGRK
jgi:pimeloyl-ACP methyl ester carboxylesterase